ncbi:hypothetical protein CH333_03245 [candidate division WOR-3 bacterium JGI_Cruoil_03_44_89]|uniref:Uncharacterized protein n=1 Tax=candidate division WOR-3 bacterium JGI_Cruoil_03_44_89 TaxID=1973748 RepID=A0A235BWB0_UNCW3|nr:MAG: hypothetical protein CH333_03245 [candidate division WOR-3 bacterium JGI_Cruoil_03_44_89]
MPAIGNVVPKKGMRVKVFNLDDTKYYGLGRIIDVYNGFEPPECLIKLDDGIEYLDTACDWVDKGNADRIEISIMGRVLFKEKPMHIDDTGRRGKVESR